MGNLAKMVHVVRSNNPHLLPANSRNIVWNWRRNGASRYTDNASALGVAVLFNHVRTARWLSGEGADLTCRRRSGLFTSYNNDLRLLARSMPHLVQQVLDGFVISEKVEGAFKALDLDLRYLVGCADIPVRHTPLRVFLDMTWDGVWTHVVVQLMIYIKWSQFGIRCFWLEFLPCLTLCVFFLGLALNDADEQQQHAFWKYAAGINALYLFLNEVRELFGTGPLKYFKSCWNIFSVLAYVLIMVILPLDLIYKDENPEYLNTTRRMIMTPSVFFLILRIMEFCQVLPLTSKFISMLGLMIKDISQWSILFILLLACFSLSFHVLLSDLEVGFDTLGDAFMTTFAMTLGDFRLPIVDHPAHADRNTLAVVLFVILTFIVVITYINLLVAMMSTSYTKIDDRANIEAIKSLGMALYRWESTFKTSTRRQNWGWITPPKDKAFVGMQRHLTRTVIPYRFKGVYDRLIGGWAETELTCYGDHIRAVAVVDPEKGAAGLERIIAKSEDSDASGQGSMEGSQGTDGLEDSDPRYSVVDDEEDDDDVATDLASRIADATATLAELNLQLGKDGDGEAVSGRSTVTKRPGMISKEDTDKCNRAMIHTYQSTKLIERNRKVSAVDEEGGVVTG